MYPLRPTGGAWSPRVRVFREGDDAENEVLAPDDAWECGIVSAAAIERP